MNDPKKDPKRLDPETLRILRESRPVKPPVELAPAPPAPNQPSPNLLGELMALAATVRQCQRNGHPDLSKHLETLLTKLGA